MASPLGLDRILPSILRELKAKDKAKDEAIELARAITKLSGGAIINMHSEAVSEAAKKLEEVNKLLKNAFKLTKRFPEFLYEGPLPSALQEYAEARIVEEVLANRALPSPESLSIPAAPYIMGLADAVGEFRRFFLDWLRKDEYERAEWALSVMESVYDALKTLEQDRYVLSGLRRKCDVVRRIVEEARRDLTMALQERKLRRDIEVLKNLECWVGKAQRR